MPDPVLVADSDVAADLLLIGPLGRSVLLRGVDVFSLDGEIMLTPRAGVLDGRPVVFVLPFTVPGAPAAIVEARRRRALTLIEGRCPCGVEREKLSRQRLRQAERSGTTRLAEVRHDDLCSACGPAYKKALAEYDWWLEETGRRIAAGEFSFSGGAA